LPRRYAPRKDGFVRRREPLLRGDLLLVVYMETMWSKAFHGQETMKNQVNKVFRMVCFQQYIVLL